MFWIPLSVPVKISLHNSINREKLVGLNQSRNGPEDFSRGDIFPGIREKV